VLAIPDPPVSSVAVSDTVTADGYVVLEQVALLHRMVVVGAVPSIRTSCDLTASVLPAVSTEKNFTVDVLATEKAVVYRVLDVVGVDPSVV
jgi:hypothetical protein